MKYVIAVSGGVDSVVLLDQLMKMNFPESEKAEFVVAHFDHGIRSESAGDAQFVKQLAEDYGITFELGTAALGEGASEELARQARYEFLHTVRSRHRADAIITAHHQDDVLETAIINIIRGTGWRGLVSLGSAENLVRPLLNTSKLKILEYAKNNKLPWREDRTNKEERYLRNYVRNRMIPAAEVKHTSFKEAFLSHITDLRTTKRLVNIEIAHLLDGLAKVDSNAVSIPRYHLIMWPREVAAEVVYHVLTKLDSDWQPSQVQIKRAVHFIKSADPGKTLQISKQLHTCVSKGVVQFKKV